MTLTINEIADVINISVSNPSESGYDVFVGLEHYDIGEPFITRFGSTKMLTTACKKFSAGDILLARRNVYLRRAGVVEFDGLTSGDSIVIRVKPNLSIEGVDSNAISRLLPFILNTNAFWDFANTNSDGTMSKRLSPQMLLSYEFELPPVADQKPLADKLWAAYKLKASKIKLIDAIDEMVKSQFIEMFGTPENNHKGFPVTTVRDIIESINYGTSKPATEDGSVPYLRMNNITYDGHLDLSEIKYINLSIEDDEKAFVRKGDMMFNRTNTKEFVGKTCVFNQDTPMVIAGYIIRVRFKAGYYSEYVSGYLNSQYGKKRLREMAKGAVHQANINAQEFQSILILNISEELQKQYIAIVEQADKSKSVCRQTIKRLAS